MADPFSQPSGPATRGAARRLSQYQIPGTDGGRRYKLPIPGKGPKGEYWVSATTLAHVISETYTLGQWQQRRVIHGLVAKPELYAEAASIEWQAEMEREDEELMAQAGFVKSDGNKLVEKARDAGGANFGSTMGTAYHKYTELADIGRINQVPLKHRADIQAYVDALNKTGITPIHDYTERACVCPEYMLSGTMDRVFSGRDFSGLVIGDVKTAKHVDYGMCEIAIQLSIYANATHMFNLDDETYSEMPNVRKDKALVIWLPVGRKMCELKWVDIEAGWSMVRHALAVYNYRKSNNRLATSYEPLDTPDWAALISAAESRDELSKIWKRANGSGEWTDELAALGKRRLEEL